MNLQSTPYAIPIILAAMTALLLAYGMWRRRPGPGVYPFVLLMVGLAIWSFLNATELSIEGVQNKALVAALEYIGITTVPAAWLLFAIEYTGHEKWITRRRVALLTIEPVLVLAALFTNQWHHLFWTTYSLDSSSGFV